MNANLIKGVWQEGVPVVPANLTGTAFQAEAEAHTIEITCLNADGSAASVSGTVTAKVLRSDGVTRVLTGTLSGNVVSVTLTQMCYEAPGRLTIAVYLTTGSREMVLWAAVANVYRTTSGAEWVEDGTVIPSLSNLTEALNNAIQATRDANTAAAAADTARLALQDTIDTQVNAAGYPYTATGAFVAVHPVKDSRIDFVEHIAPVQAGSGDPSPSNVRPITAPESVSVTRFGENLLMPFTKAETVNGVTFTPNDDGSVSYSGTPSAANIACSSTRFSSIVIWLEAGTYTLSGNGAGGLNVNEIYIRPYGGSTILARAYTGSNDATFTISERMRVEYILRANSNATVGTAISGKFWPKLELGSTATAFKPWTGYAVTVTLPDGVYGGEYDSKTGTVKVTHNCLVLDGVTEGLAITSKGTASGTVESSNFYGIRTSDGTLFGLGPSSWVSAETLGENVTFSHGLPVSANHSDTFGFTGYISSSSKLQLRLVFPGADVTVAQANTFLQEQYAAGTPCTLVYPLAVPFTVTLSPSTLRAASPAQLNHVWTNNGTISVSGPTDLKWLIDSLHPNG